MRDLIVALLFAILLATWIGAELYGARRTRILLGLMCLAVLSGAIYVVIQSTGMQIAMHRMVLRQIDLKLEANDTAVVRRALDTYQQTYSSTGDSKAAAARTMRILSGE